MSSARDSAAFSAASAKEAPSPEFRDFSERFFHRAAPEDLNTFGPEQQSGIAQLFWNAARTRRPGQPFVSVLTPTHANTGWEAGTTLVCTIVDDKPFLVDSVTGALKERSLRIHAVFHPIIPVARNSDGSYRGLAADGKAPGAHAESMICVAINRIESEARRREIQEEITSVLADVSLAVSDWREMLMRLSQSIAELRMRPPRAAADEVGESLRFLEWIEQNHFTFLGCRDYAFDPEGEGRLRPQPETGLGLLRDPERRVIRRGQDRTSLTPEVRGFLMQPSPLIITKANVRSTVHRRVHQDYIGIKRFDTNGNLTGERRFVGLFTSAAYSATPSEIPFLSRKVQSVRNRAGFGKSSHDAKALERILETYPRDELFQIADDDLLRVAQGIVYLLDRPRTKAFLRFDTFDRFVSALVFVPAEKFRARLVRDLGRTLGDALEADVAFNTIQNDEGQLTRVHFILNRRANRRPAVDEGELSERLEAIVRTWADEFGNAIHQAMGTEEAEALLGSYADAFGEGYREVYPPHEALQDVMVLEEMRRSNLPSHDLGMRTWRAPEDGQQQLRLKIYKAGDAIALSDILPVLENFGLRVDAELSHGIDLGKEKFTIHQFALKTAEGTAFDEAQEAPLFEDSLRAVWRGQAENDGFNRLTLAAGIGWRDVAILRGLAKYLRQIAMPFSQALIEAALSRQAKIANHIVSLFHARHDPALGSDLDARQAQTAEIVEQIEQALVTVPSLDDDRILRRYRNLVLAIVRTNVFQPKVDDSQPPAFAFKLKCSLVEDLPLPRPLFEIFVYAPDLEGVHLRFGKVARGGIRWSDRREDFRTEILGLVKAQQVKNVVIVPAGSKGGFYPKRLPAPQAGRDAFQAAGVAAYKRFIATLLDVTDNIDASGTVVPPPSVMRWDENDPYLVVAADKGTATFSDIANGVSRAYGFWLDDAFASGGSAGYDHKKMGITARGAWEAVKRHFRELGRDTQTEPFTVVGVGDMSGDVFGNGMLLSRQIKLLAAFDHRDVFLDPNPVPAVSYVERQRMFALARSSWADYDRTKISKGGGVYSRSLKSIPISPEVQAAFGIKAKEMEPNALIQALLRANVDLLWFGGIGTFVKASHETHAAAGDRASDPLRVDALELRAKVIGEGANLGLTQAARIEFARAGGSINTDAIDNSAGVDTSDHEVNLKILLNAAIARGELAASDRDHLLEELTDHVAHLVLQDNYLQTRALTAARATAHGDLEAHGRLMRTLEQSGRLNRAVETLPTDEEMRSRGARGEGLTRPELAVLMAYAKLDLKDTLISSKLPDDPAYERSLQAYFPDGLAARMPKAMAAHRLRREIIATGLANDLINRCGPAFLQRMREASSAPSEAIVRAYAMTVEVFALQELDERINALDGKIDAGNQTEMHASIIRHCQRQTLWFLRRIPATAPLHETIATFKRGVDGLRGTFHSLVSQAEARQIEANIAALGAAGVPNDLADDVAVLPAIGAVPDIVQLASQGQPLDFVAGVFFAIGRVLGVDRLRLAADAIRLDEHWDRLAIRRIADDLFGYQRAMTAVVLRESKGKDRNAGAAAVEIWSATHAKALSELEELLGQLDRLGAYSVARLTLAAARIRDVLESTSTN